ncbi:hypothetical protein F4859DRAFT_134993 [Xylaria cf. heliscus]|nr:hypothetical protein F4859DRAFT_134993 [Xylaria cf. heliscus]
MGGLAFASGPGRVFTPRMQPAIYRAVRDRCQAKLRELFVVVATPIEGPAKTSFGDIDFFVAWERKNVFPSLQPASSSSPPDESPKEAIYRVLGAISHRSGNKSVATIAIPWPEDFPYSNNEAGVNSPESEKNDDEKSPTTELQPLGIQVDIHICPTLEHMQWMLFKHAHSDLWNILGTMLRPLGLTIDEVGLYVRIPEIEALDKKKAKVLLSTDPAEILRFLGLRFDGGQWEEPFASDEAMFDYAATCRLFWVKTDDDDGGGGGDGADHHDGSGAGAGTGTGVFETGAEGEELSTATATAAAKRKLKANDRRRMASRPLFRNWIETYLPALRRRRHHHHHSSIPTSLPLPPPPTRPSVLTEAFTFFPGTSTLYFSQATTFHLERQRSTLWNRVIKPSVPVPPEIDERKRGCCTAALKKIIVQGDVSSFGDSGVDFAAQTSALMRADGLFDEDAVRVWVADNWRRVLDVAWEVDQQRYRESVRLKDAAAAAAAAAEAAEAAVVPKTKPKRTASGSEKSC